MHPKYKRPSRHWNPTPTLKGNSLVERLERAIRQEELDLSLRAKFETATVQLLKEALEVIRNIR